MDMDPELKKKIDETLELTKENHKILKSMRSHARWSSIMRAVYWLIILVTAFGAYYFVKPVIDDVMEAYSGVVDSINSVKEAGQKFTNPFSRDKATTTSE